jgi:hypothetical protein
VSDEVLKLAVPLLTAPVPRVVAPSRNVIVPVAVEATVAVKVTDWLKLEGLTEDVRETDGPVLLTV